VDVVLVGFAIPKIWLI